MGTIATFEDLEVWKQSVNLCTEVYQITNESELAKDFSLRDQIRKSAISIPSNISEGFERNSNKSFIYFLIIAKGSCGELRTQLLLANRLSYISDDKYNHLLDRCLEVSKQLSGFITYLKNIKSN